MSGARRLGFAGGLCCLMVVGCGRFDAKPAEKYVYVTAKQANLRDRVAAVSNRTGQVQNGDRLKVLERGRHSVKVQTAKGQVGWIEEKMIATDETAAEFERLKDEHKGDAEVASGVVRDQVYMHVKPGRDTERFYLLNEGDKLKLLRRATLEKSTAGVAAVKAQKAIPQAAGTDAKRRSDAVAVKVVDPSAGAPVMEDWWLVRDAEGHTGWVYSRMMDVDAPDALTRYAEGQRIVGAYVLTTVHDGEAPGGPADVPVYVTVMSSYKAGLAYDFDQVRVFTWSLNHHRYETGFRNKNIEGFLPVVVGKAKDPAEKGALGQEELPVFTYRVLAADAPAVAPDPVTGEMKPGKTIAKTFRLEGNLVRRMGGVAGAPWAQGAELEAHPVEEEKKGKKKR